MLVRHLVVVFLVVTIAKIHGSENIYVSEGYNDSEGCGSQKTPCGSIQAGISAACTANSSVPIVWVEDGDYIQETVVITCSLTLRSVNGSEFTRIIANETSPAIQIRSINNGSIAIYGFEIFPQIHFSEILVDVPNLYNFYLDDIRLHNFTGGTVINAEINGTFSASNIYVDSCNMDTLLYVSADSTNITFLNVQSCEISTILYTQTFTQLVSHSWRITNVTEIRQLVYCVDNSTLGATFNNMSLFGIESFVHATSSVIECSSENVYIQDSTFQLISRFETLMVVSNLICNNVNLVEIFGKDLLQINGDVFSLDNATFTAISMESDAIISLSNHATATMNQVIVRNNDCRDFFSAFGQTLQGNISNSYFEGIVDSIVNFGSEELYFTIQNCTFANLIADSSMAIFFAEFEVGIFQVMDCVFDNNQMRAISIHTELGIAKIHHCNFTNNRISEVFISFTGLHLDILDVEMSSVNGFACMDVYAVVFTMANVIVDSCGVENSVISIANTQRATISDLQISNTQSNPKYILQISANVCNITNYTSQYNRAGFGGALTIAFSNVTITDSSFTNSTGGYGGAIYVQGSHFSMLRSNISFCSATSGGGIRYEQDTSGLIQHCFITDNEATSNGGGIYFGGTSHPTLENTVVLRNSATNGGGVFTTDSSWPTFQNCSFINCSAKTSGGCAEFTGSSTPSFVESTLVNCVAISGGSGVTGRDFSQSSYTNVLIMNNECGNDGGGMFFTDQSCLTMQDSQLQSNHAGSTGGAMVLSVNSTGLITNTIFTNNTGGSNGGVIAVYDTSSIDITSSEFHSATAKSGGCIYSTDFSHLRFTNCTFANNLATSRGGTTYATSDARLSFTACRFTKNRSNGAGGAIFIEDSGIFNATNSYFANNSGSIGGALYINSDYGAWIYACTLEDNIATGSGGALLISAVQMKTSAFFGNSSCTFNRAIEGTGGCLFMESEAQLVISNVYLSNNRGNTGGALGITGVAYAYLEASVITSNQAQSGGGISSNEAATLLADGVIFTNNTATNNGGALLVHSLADTVFLQTKFDNNSASKGGAVYFSYSEQALQFGNCSFDSNNAISGGGIYIEQPTSTSQPNHESLLKPTENYSFQNVSLQNNLAFYGGALYFESTAIPPFGPPCSLYNNTASAFGGAIYFENYNNPVRYPVYSLFLFNVIKETTMFGVDFNGNVGIYGGANVAFQEIANTTQAGEFCAQCLFSNTNGPKAGYQNDKGFATAPSALQFDNNIESCPGSITLDVGSLDITVFLFDEFETVVTGQLLVDYPIYVSLNYTKDKIQVSNANFTQIVQASSGGAYFNHTSFCGPNNSSTLLTFIPIYPLVYQSMEGASCSVSLFGCKEGYKVEVSDSPGGCDTCVATLDIDNKRVAYILVAIIFTLCLLLCALLAFLSARRYAQKRKIAKKQALQIPDFVGKPQLTLEDILKDPAIPQLSWSDIVIGEAIGKGASGLVSKGIWKTNISEKDIALKELLFGFQEFGMEILDEFLIEIKYMSALSHKNIVEFYGICVTPDLSKLYLVTELMHQGSVRDLLERKKGNLPWDIRWKMAKDAAKGMDYLHKKKLIHRDLKSENLLMNDRWECKVADFGISTVRPTVTREMTCIGTPVYMAPEVLRKNKYSEKADVFSFGIVLWEIFTGDRPYSTGLYRSMNQAQLMFAIVENQARLPLDGLDNALQQLIRDCWSTDPRVRPSFSEIVVRLRRMKVERKRESKAELESDSLMGDDFSISSVNSVN